MSNDDSYYNLGVEIFNVAAFHACMAVFVVSWRDEQGHFGATHAAEVARRKGGIGGGGAITLGRMCGIVHDGCVDGPSVELFFAIDTTRW